MPDKRYTILDGEEKVLVEQPDGTFADRVVVHGNRELTVLASAERAETTNSAAQDNAGARGLHVIVDVTDVTETPSITPKIQAQDPASEEWYDLLVGAAITTVSRAVLKVYPGITAAANAAASDVLPRTWRVRVEHADGDAIEYSVGAALVI